MTESQISDRVLTVLGKYIRIASVKDEAFLEGDAVDNPPAFIHVLRKSHLKADLFTFPQRIGENQPKYNYVFEWDNAAVIPTTDYNDWWERNIPQETRKNVRRAAKKCVSVKVVEFSDTLVDGIKRIYDESSFRQGRRFWHYGKDCESVKKENATYLERSTFLGAFYQEELIGFLKFVRVNGDARLMQILAMNNHQDKRPMNALIAKAVEICCQGGLQRLIYGKYNYGNKKISQLAEFKRRNGFREVRFPRYYIPITLRGQIALVFGLHRGPLGLLPSGLIDLLLRLRAGLLRAKQRLPGMGGSVQQIGRPKTAENP